MKVAHGISAAKLIRFILQDIDGGSFGVTTAHILQSGILGRRTTAVGRQYRPQTTFTTKDLLHLKDSRLRPPWHHRRGARTFLLEHTCKLSTTHTMPRGNSPSDGVIDLTESPPISPAPVVLTYPLSNLPTRASVNNPNQPVALPTFSGSFDGTRDSPPGCASLTEDEMEDEDLRKAIALSLQSHQEPQRKDVIHTDDDIATSTDGSAHPEQREETPKVEPNKDLTDGSVAFGLLGLDRATMEAARLLRLKRKREAEATAATSDSKGYYTVPTANGSTRTISLAREISPPPKRSKGTNEVVKDGLKPITTLEREAADYQILARSMANASSSTERVNIVPPPTPCYYPMPALLRTHSPLEANTSNTAPLLPTTTFSTLVANPTAGLATNLTSALLSSFTTDFDFILPLLNARSTIFVFILHATSTAHERELQSSFSEIDTVRLVFPKAIGGYGGSGTMHSKFGALFYGPEPSGVWKHGRCRLIVPTGNLVSYDWGQNGSISAHAPPQARENAKKNIENLVWVVDLPMLAPSVPPPGETYFQKGLMAYIKAHDTMPKAVIQKFGKLDFSATKGIGWVCSQAGFHYPQDPDTKGWGARAGVGMGLYDLSKTVRDLGLAAKEDEEVQVEFLTSSLGSLTAPWLAILYDAVSGRLVSSEKRPATADVKEKKRAAVTTPVMPAMKASNITASAAHNLRIYYPSRETVKNSLPGPDDAGTICFSDQWWERPTFPCNNIRDAVSTSLDGKGLMHAKVIAVRFAKAREATGDHQETGKVVLGWCYVGSANCSESAWGKVTVAPSKLTVRNWESGVVFPVYAVDDAAGAGKAKGSAIRPGEEVTLKEWVRALPLPMRLPGESMVETGKRPWSGANFG